MANGTKTSAIQKEPLLRGYFKLFQDVLREGNKRLLVIGYGFRDMHINKILVDSVQNHGLKLIVITTASPDEFRDNLTYGHFYAMGLRDGISHYCQGTLREIFPPDQSGSTALDDLRDALLQDE